MAPFQEPVMRTNKFVLAPTLTTLAILASLLVAGAPVAAVQASEPTNQEMAGSRAGEQRDVGGVPLCWCPAGSFRMGSPAEEPERRPGEDQVQVTLTRGFWMGKHEVTQGIWKRVMGSLPGDVDFGAGDDFPVYNVNFSEANGFCRALGEQLRAHKALPDDWEFRLPTEAQWEYACRAGTTTATAHGPSLNSLQANFKGKFPYQTSVIGPSHERTVKVGSYPPNAWNLHDMHGNVFEWCRDWYHPRLPGGADPDLSSVPARSRVRRGGCFADEGWPCRSAFRLRFEPERKHNHIGFRIVAVHL
jgi:formylglycine-generating enzyme required for sulfatase activity